MPHAPESTHPPHDSGRPRRERLLWVAALVALGHWLLLTGVPAAKPLDLPSAQSPSATAMSFTVHTVVAPEPSTGFRPAAPTPSPLARPPGPATATPATPAAQSAAETKPPSAVADAAAGAAADATTHSGALADPSGGVPAVYREPANGVGDTAWVLAALASDATGQSSAVGAPYRFGFPESVRIGYDVQGRSGFAYSASADIVWRREGGSYQAALRVSKLGIPLSVWTSKGSLGAQGVAPLRFGEKRDAAARLPPISSATKALCRSAGTRPMSRFSPAPKTT